MTYESTGSIIPLFRDECNQSNIFFYILRGENLFLPFFMNLVRPQLSIELNLHSSSLRTHSL